MGVGLELFGRRRDGSEFPVEISLSPLAHGGETLVITAVRDVTERQAAELRFQTLIESAPDGFLLVDRDGRITLANRRAHELFGYPREELVGRLVEALVPTRLRASHVIQRDRYAEHPRTRPMGAGLELHGVRKDGSEFPLEISLSPIVFGTDTMTATVVRDISDRKAAEAERLELARSHSARSEAEAAATRLRSIQAVMDAALIHLSLDEVLDAVVEPVRDGLEASTVTILLCQAAQEELVVRASIGLEAEVEADVAVPIGEELVGRIAAEEAPRVFDAVTDALSPLLREAGIVSLVAAPLRAGNELLGVIHAGTRTHPPFDADDADLLQLFADRIALAISEARLFEAEREALALAEAARTQMREIVSDLNAIVWEADTTDRNRLTFVGGRAEDIVGYPLDRWAEEDFWSSVIHADDRERVILFFREAAGELCAHELEYRLVSAEGRTVWVRDIVRVAGEAESGSTRLRGVMVDVTERRELAERLVHSQKMEAVGQLAGGIAHDFNNLLTVISGFTSLLQARLEDDRSKAELTEISRATDRAAALTRQLLAFSRRQPQAIELIDISELVRGLEQMLRRLVGEDVELEVSTSAQPLLIEADSGQLEQALVNLVVNASDAMPQGGRLEIESSSVLLDERAAAELELPAQAYVQLVISDTGIGMTDETAARVFEPFFTTKPTGKGTGLGLSSVYGMVKGIDGRIQVTSELGRGTRFSLWFPPAAAAPRAARAATATILLAEDEPALRRLARIILEERYDVIEARNGREAFELAERHSGSIDLLLTDIVMPELSGPELVTRLAPLRPEMRVLYMSGYTDRRLAGRGFSEKDNLIIRKPFAPDELREMVAAIVEAPT
jgi:two-component system cell cycle sensor histidine kinase/response regulator CckA